MGLSAKQTKRVFTIVSLCAGLLFSRDIPVKAAPENQIGFHIVQSGDTWQSIAAHRGVPVDLLLRANGVVNPSLLAEGQRLFIPATDQPARNDLITLKVGEETSIWYVALQSGNALSTILYMNNLSCPFVAYGRQVVIPNNQNTVAQASTPAPPPPTDQPTPPGDSDSPEPTPTLPPEPVEPGTGNGALLRSRMGIQGHFSIPDEDTRQLLDMVAYSMGFGWVKTQVDWSKIEYMPGQYSSELDKLDAFVNGAYDRELLVLLSVVKAPDWARNTTDEDGPPTDYNHYYAFLKFLILRYKFKLTAIEIWNEPNLGREWRGGTLSGEEYVRLLTGAYEVVKREEGGRIMVISAGLAPTGVTDGVNSVDDRLYLRQMYEAGLSNHTDVVGIHPYGWANPPQIRCCHASEGPPSHNDHPSFFFLNTIEDYRAIQSEFGDSGRPLWATEFGWGTMEGLGLPIPVEQPFFAYVNQTQQAEYIRDAFLIAQEWDFMGPMFLWNLNIATLDGFDPNQAGYSILNKIDRPRPAYNLLRDAPKIDDMP